MRSFFAIAISALTAMLLIARPVPAQVLAAAALSAARKGDAGIREGDFSTASHAYAAAALDQPNDPLLHVMAGVGFASSQHEDLALEQFRESVRLDDRDVVAALLLQAALAEQGSSAEAQSILVDVDRHFARSDGMPGLDSSAAIARLTRRIRQEPDSPMLYLLLGDAYQLGEDWYRADTAYRSATLLSPTWTKPIVNRGLALFAQRKTEDAIRIFSVAVRLDPHDAQTKVWIGEAQLRDGRSARAISTLNAVADAPGVTPNVRAQAAIPLGQAFANEKNYPKAFATLNRAQRLSPRDPTPIATLGDLHVQAGDYPAATSDYKAALRLTYGDSLFGGTRPTLFRALAEAQLSAHRPADAALTLREALRSDAEDAPLWHRLLAQTAWDRGDPAEAEAELCAALDCEPNRYPFDTLNALAAHDLLPAVQTRYQAQRDAAGKPENAQGVAALRALASIARYENRMSDEIALRRYLTALRSFGPDWYLLADTCDQRAKRPLDARDAYRRAIEAGGLNPAQLSFAHKRLNALTAPAYKP